MARAPVIYLKEEHWKKIAPLLPEASKRGRPRQNLKLIVEGIMWVLRTGARWKDLPERYPSPATCWRYLKRWEAQKVWLKIMLAFLTELNEQGRLRWDEGFMDGTFASAKKGASRSAKPRRGKAPS
jgi:transposase